MVEVLHTVADLRARVAATRAGGGSVGLVPTMGALHEGHLTLIRAARAASDLVVVSVFVNPTQFDDANDLAAYPRTLATDAAAAADAGADVVFAPAVAEVYPAGFATTVSVAGALTGTLEGAHRGAAHFAGVATVVAKLFGMVTPDAAWFGAKDAQQLLVVRRMTRDLDLPVRVIAVPTVREPDGLAMSSRNVRLSLADRERATALIAALRAVADAVAAGERDAAVAATRGVDVLAAHGIDPEYLAVVHPATLEPLTTLDGPALVAVAARVGPVRLIDNCTVEPGRAGRF